MDVFDIMGPVMIGPSSSHTAGAVRMGRAARELLGERPVDVLIKLHGSFACTYKGHGTDKGLIAGLMGMSADNESIKDSLAIAADSGMRFRFETTDIKDAHPNSAVIEAAGQSGRKVSVLGASTGGGNIRIDRINGLEVKAAVNYNTLVVTHRDAPGMIAAVTGILACNAINIAQMRVYRSARGGEAIMVIETDERINEPVTADINRLPRVTDVRTITPV